MSKSDRTVAQSEPLSLDDGVELRSWPFYWIVQAHGAYFSVLEAELKRVDLDIPRWRALSLLQDGRASSISYLAQEARTKLSTMTRIVQRMEQDQLVITRSATRDARVTEALLTSRGLKAREVAWTRAHAVYAKAFAKIPDRKVTQLVSILEDLTSNLE